MSSPGHTCLISQSVGSPDTSTFTISPTAPLGSAPLPPAGPAHWPVRGRPPILGALPTLVLLLRMASLSEYLRPALSEGCSGPPSRGSLAPLPCGLSPGARSTRYLCQQLTLGLQGSSCASFTVTGGRERCGPSLCPSQPHLGRCSLDTPHLPSEIRQMRTRRPGRVSPTCRLLTYEMKGQHLPLAVSASETLTEGGTCRASSWGVSGSISAGVGPLSPCFWGSPLPFLGSSPSVQPHIPVDQTPAP